MALALNIRSDHQTSSKIEQLWQDCSRLEESPSMINLGYRPHITFAIYDDIDSQLLLDIFDTVFASVHETAISFNKIDMFESPDSLVLWANPVLPASISAIHGRIHELINVNTCRDHYRPSNWIPHCSLATSIPLNRKAEAISLCEQAFEPFEVIFDVVDLVSFLPIKILKEREL